MEYSYHYYVFISVSFFTCNYESFEPFVSTWGRFSSAESIILHRHVSKVAQNRQTKTLARDCLMDS